MSQKFMNMMRIQASIVNNSRTLTSLGSVIAYDPVKYLVQVQLYPEDAASGAPALQTGWIPLFSQWVGNGFGLFMAPNIGDIIEVHYPEGSLQNGYAGLRTFNLMSLPSGANIPSGGIPSGEAWLIHTSGSIIKLTNDGKVGIISTVEIDVTAPIVNAISPEVNLGNGSLAFLLTAAAALIYNSHTHNISGGGITLVPNQLMTSADNTTNTQAS